MQVTPGIGVQFSVEPPTGGFACFTAYKLWKQDYMWIWYNGCAPALQAGNVGSIPSIHSNFIAMQRIIY